MKKLLLTASFLSMTVAAAEASTFPVFAIDGSTSSITVTEGIDLCFGCSLSASFSAGVDGATWTPTSPTDSWNIANFIDWNASGSGFGAAVYNVALTIGFSSPDAASSSTTGDVGFLSIFGHVNAGLLIWDSIGDLTFAQGSTLSIALQGGAAIGTGNTVSSGVTFTGNTIAPIPLPASGLLLLAGVAGLGSLRRKRKAAA